MVFSVVVDAADADVLCSVCLMCAQTFLSCSAYLVQNCSSRVLFFGCPRKLSTSAKDIEHVLYYLYVLEWFLVNSF